MGQVKVEENVVRIVLKSRTSTKVVCSMILNYVATSVNSWLGCSRAGMSSVNSHVSCFILFV